MAGAAEMYGVPLVALVAMPEAESSYYPFAERWGDRTNDVRRMLHNRAELAALIEDLERRGLGADISFGYAQIIVSTAAVYGIGDGTNSVSNVLHVRERLFDRRLSIEIGARHLAAQYPKVPTELRGEWSLQALIAYNSGSPQPRGNWYWRHPVYKNNPLAYQRALKWAEQLVTRQLVV